jgi:hypothetical protein
VQPTRQSFNRETLQKVVSNWVVIHATRRRRKSFSSAIEVRVFAELAAGRRVGHRALLSCSRANASRWFIFSAHARGVAYG